jgi:drug/metabolite transporter (DMT)-like permease
MSRDTTAARGQPVSTRGVGTDTSAYRSRLPGMAVAGATALVSGVAVFVNSYGVHAVRQPAVYTTAKNLVAALTLALGAVLLRARRARPRTAGASPRRRMRAAEWVGLAYVGVVGGGVAFVLFFVGLARTTAEPASFLHDTLVVWVALLALPFLGERLSPWNVAAIVALVAGQVAVTGGVGHLVAGRGQALVLAATVLWAVETVVAKPLLRVLSPDVVAIARMGIGAVVLVVYVTATGHLAMLVGLDAHQMKWVAVTGLLLSAYVATWMVALARGRAVDVTSVLVASVIVTAMLDAAVDHTRLAPQALGLALVAVGVTAIVGAWPRPVPSSQNQAP